MSGNVCFILPRKRFSSIGYTENFRTAWPDSTRGSTRSGQFVDLKAWSKIEVPREVVAYFVTIRPDKDAGHVLDQDR